MIRSIELKNIYKRINFFLLCEAVCFVLIFFAVAQAQVLPPFNTFLSPLSIFQTAPYTLFPFSFPFPSPASFNPLFSPFSVPALPTPPSTTNPIASALGILVPPPPVPVAKIAGTTITATSALTEVQVRIWLGGPPLSLVLPVPTTIYIVPSAASVSGLLIPPPPVPFVPVI